MLFCYGVILDVMKCSGPLMRSTSTIMLDLLSLCRVRGLKCAR